MIDFTNCEINNFKYYGGKNGGKICIKYNCEDEKILKVSYEKSIKNKQKTLD